MPHYVCATCKTRLRAAGTPAELAGELCPQCGSPLEPVANLAGLIGSRSIDRCDEADHAVPEPSHQANATRLDEFIVRRAEQLERKRAVFAALSRLDGDDSPADAVAVALPLPLPLPRTDQ
jgi:hypothetical protein